MKIKHASAYTVCKNALLANNYATESATRLAKRFSANGASIEKAVDKLNKYLNQ